MTPHLIILPIIPQADFLYNHYPHYLPQNPPLFALLLPYAPYSHQDHFQINLTQEFGVKLNPIHQNKKFI